MDEVIFRGSQKLENLQVQLGMVATEGKNILNQYAQQSKDTIKNLVEHTEINNYRDAIKHFCRFIINALKETQQNVHVHTKKLYDGVLQLVGKQFSNRDIYFLSIGFICGGLVGISLGFIVFKKNSFHHYMQAIQCMHYLGIESVSVVEDALAPYCCDKNDVLINVKSASVHVIDANICSGYGRIIRKLLNKNQHLPVTLGRDCTGIITDIGSNISRLEVGDEVWVTVPFWAPGTMCQTILVPENRVSRKPKTVGYESACSLPYAGSIALATLKQIGVTPENALNKKILIMDGCSPVGCVLIQILKLWGAQVTVTCFSRASPVAKALGANKVITLEKLIDAEIIKRTLIKELELRDQFDFIIKTKECPLTLGDLQNYCQTDGCVISTMPPVLSSDSYGFIMRFIFGTYVRMKRLVGSGMHDFDETHMCHAVLDQLTDYVENGDVQTVVDKVYHPQDIETALNHIQSSDAIGSTVITFR